MPNWNPQQLKAIQTKDKNIMVSASAGSGKTTVLIARLMDLVVKDRVPIDAILAMTFTEAAASEMKKRLAASLQKAYEETKDPEERAYITRQLTSIQTAHISTIHSFCLSILQEYYYMIGLDATRITNIMDNGTMVLYQGKALEEAFQNQYTKQDKVFIDLCAMFSSRSENDEALRKLITSLAVMASSQANSDAWLDALLIPYDNIKHIQDLPIGIQENFFSYLAVECSRYEEGILRIQELYRYRYDSEVKKAALVEQKVQALPFLQETLTKRDYEGFRLAFQSIAHGILPPSPDKEDKEYVHLRKQSQELEDRLLGLLFSEQQFIKDMQALKPYIQKLIEMVKDYRMSYARIKQEQAVIDFDDMEHYALEILQCKHGQVAQRYREQFTEIMVDEFQDSNDVQNTLVQLICRENNVFRVGDVKQSIYGFRHAKPSLMRGIIEQQGIYDEVIYLSNNYRSKKMIVDFNNLLFKQLMNLDGFSCRYADADDVETGVAEQLQDNVPICFHAIFHDEIKKTNALILAKNDLKASYIANQILEIREKEQRQWKDFVVLVRGNARKENMKKVFDELHIPYFIDVKSGFYQSSAVSLMLSALRAIEDPHNDIALIAILLSPLFPCSAEQIAQSKLAKRQVAQKASQQAAHKVYESSFYAYLKEHPIPGFQAFEELRKQCFDCSLTETLNRLYEQNNYYALHTSVQEKTNLDLLFEKGATFEQQQAMGIHAFLNQIEQIKDAQTAEAIPIGSEADVVRVMSIHQSKGLQFPVVFLWSNDAMTAIEFKDLCICDSELGIALKRMELPERYVRTTIPRIAMEHKKDKEELEEEMRILYVATTRAQQQMHIVDCVLDLEQYNKPLTTSSIYDRGGYTSWLLQTFLQHPNDLFTIKEVHTLWQNLSLQEQMKPQYHIQPYHQKVETLQFATASAKKATDIAITLQKQKGMQYGTMMHKMIEALGNSSCEDTAIRQCAARLHITLSELDIQRLHDLYENEVFQQCLKTTCYYELPFMVKDGEEVLHGFMDFVSMQENTIVIIDFKTDAIFLANELTTRYREQLLLYQKAMQMLYPNSNIACYIYSLHLSEMIQVS